MTADREAERLAALVRGGCTEIERAMRRYARAAVAVDAARERLVALVGPEAARELTGGALEALADKMDRMQKRLQETR